MIEPTYITLTNIIFVTHILNLLFKAYKKICKILLYKFFLSIYKNDK